MSGGSVSSRLAKQQRSSQFRSVGVSRSVLTQAVALLIIAVRLSLFFLHTDAPPSHDRMGGPTLTSETHCLACDLESTCSFEASPVVVLPSEIVHPFCYIECRTCGDAVAATIKHATRGPPEILV